MEIRIGLSKKLRSGYRRNDTMCIVNIPTCSNPVIKISLPFSIPNFWKNKTATKNK